MPVNYETSDFMPKTAVVTPREAVQRQSSSHVKANVKNAVVRYLGRYFSEDGLYRDTMRDVFPDMLKFVTDLDFVPTDATDAARETKFPIFKYYNDVKAYLPCLIVSESGTTWRSSGIGRNQGTVRTKDGFCQIIHVMRSVNISLVVVTNDQATTDSIVEVLSLIFGELAGTMSGMQIQDDSAGAHWLVRFPKMVEPGTTERNQQGDDVKDLVWTSTTQLPLEYEDSFLLPYASQSVQIMPGNTTMPTLSIDVPATIRIGRETCGFVRNLETGQSVGTSDPGVLALKPGRSGGQYYLIGRKSGKAEIRVIQNLEQRDGVMQTHVVKSVLVTVAY
jgi:hypothetical protein